jgi:hypothetical protein
MCLIRGVKVYGSFITNIKCNQYFMIFKFVAIFRRACKANTNYNPILVRPSVGRNTEISTIWIFMKFQEYVVFLLNCMVILFKIR